MEVLGIGPLELVFILLIALIVLGPKDIVKAGKTVGSFLRRLVTSSGWSTFQQVSRDIRTLPNKLMRQAGIDEMQKEIQEIKVATPQEEIQKLNKDFKAMQIDLSPWTTPPNKNQPVQEASTHSPQQDQTSDPQVISDQG